MRRSSGSGLLQRHLRLGCAARTTTSSSGVVRCRAGVNGPIGVEHYDPLPIKTVTRGSPRHQDRPAFLARHRAPRSSRKGAPSMTSHPNSWHPYKSCTPMSHSSARGRSSISSGVPAQAERPSSGIASQIPSFLGIFQGDPQKTRLPTTWGFAAQRHEKRIPGRMGQK